MIGRVDLERAMKTTAMMAREHGPALVGGIPGNKTAYWARAVDDQGTLIQHSFWLFETEQDAPSRLRPSSPHCGDATGPSCLHQR